MALLCLGWEQRMRTKYPGIQQLPDGRKRIRLRVVDPRTGRNKEVDKIISGTVQEAAKLREEWRLLISNADHVAKDVPRLGAYAESWIASKALRLKPSTATWYAQRLDDHVIPVLGEFYLDKLTHEDLRTLQATLAKKMAASSVNGVMAVVKMLVGDASVDYCLRNPAQRLRSLPIRTWNDEDPNILSAEELGRVLAAIEQLTPQHHPLAMTLALTGLRFGEASALRWDDIDEALGLIRIRRAQWRGRVSTTKTGKIRSVPLVPELAAVLRDHRKRLVAAEAPGLAEGWVFPSNVGKPHAKEILRKPLQKALAAAGIKRHFTQHGLRRTFNNLSRQIAGEIVTRSITGHVTQSMTEHYSHVGGAEKLAAAGQIVRLVLADRSGDQGGDRGGDTSARSGGDQGGRPVEEAPSTAKDGETSPKWGSRWGSIEEKKKATLGEVA